MWIEVFELTEEQENEECYELTKCNIVSRFFFTIDSFAEYIDTDGLEYVSFYCGGVEWISMLKLKDFIEKYIEKK